MIFVFFLLKVKIANNNFCEGCGNYVSEFIKFGIEILIFTNCGFSNIDLNYIFTLRKENYTKLNAIFLANNKFTDDECKKLKTLWLLNCPNQILDFTKTAELYSTNIYEIISDLKLLTKYKITDFPREIQSEISKFIKNENIKIFYEPYSAIYAILNGYLSNIFVDKNKLFALKNLYFF